MTELTWTGKYKDNKKVAPVRIALPFQTIETVNESAADRQKRLNSLFNQKQETGDWRTASSGATKNMSSQASCPNLPEKLTSSTLTRHST